MRVRKKSSNYDVIRFIYNIRRVFARFSAVIFRYRHNKSHCFLCNFVSDLLKILHSTKARSKRYFQVFSCFGRPTFAFRRKCVRNSARIVCFCNLTTFFDHNTLSKVSKQIFKVIILVCFGQSFLFSNLGQEIEFFICSFLFLYLQRLDVGHQSHSK
jgi:hypothetical protein